MLDKTMLDKTVLDKTVLDKTMLNESVPNKAILNETVRNETTPNKAVINKALPHFDAEDISLLIATTQSHKKRLEHHLDNVNDNENERDERYARIDHLDRLEEKLFDWLNKCDA